MKAHELMIGDYVLYDGLILKVGGLTDYDIKIDLLKGNELYAQFWDEEMDKIQGIPITPEILEKNGFRIDEKNKWKTRYAFVDNLEKTPQTVVQFSFYKDSCPAFSLFECWTKPKDCDGENSIHICDLKFVHQLQHCLKLVGIDKDIVL